MKEGEQPSFFFGLISSRSLYNVAMRRLLKCAAVICLAFAGCSSTTPNNTNKETEETEVVSLPENDGLQALFVSLSPETTSDEFEAMLDGLEYAKEESNSVSGDKRIDYIVAYEPNVAQFKYADSGDYLQAEFSEDKKTLNHAEYVALDSHVTPILFVSGDYYSLGAGNKSGYYYTNHFSKESSEDLPKGYYHGEDAQSMIDMVKTDQENKRSE